MWNRIKAIFSSPQVGSARYQELRRNVLKELNANRPQAAMQHLGPLLGYADPPPAELADPAVWRDAMGLFAKIVDALGIAVRVVEPSESGADASPQSRQSLASLLTQLGDNPNDVEQLIGLASAMGGIGAAGIGVMFLDRALRIEPNIPIIRDKLALLLLNMHEYASAAKVLDWESGYLDEHRAGRYILVRALLWQGKVAEARRQWSLAVAPQDEYEQHYYDEADGFLRRLEAYESLCRLDRNDLRGWHFGLTGGILLHLSPVGCEVMNGRYAMLFDSVERTLECIQRLAAVLKVCNKPIPKVFALPDHESQILAAATARYLGCPVQPWGGEGTDEVGLLVAYSLNQIEPELGATLAHHRPGQIFWAHTCSWLEDVPVAPDLVSLLVEHNLSPWAERPENFQGIAPQRTGTIDVLADEILSAQVEGDALRDLPDLCQWVSSLPTLPERHAPGIQRNAGQRRVFYADSPVPSNSFRGVGRQVSS